MEKVSILIVHLTFKVHVTIDETYRTFINRFCWKESCEWKVAAKACAFPSSEANFCFFPIIHEVAFKFQIKLANWYHFLKLATVSLLANKFFCSNFIYFVSNLRKGYKLVQIFLQTIWHPLGLEVFEVSLTYAYMSFVYDFCSRNKCKEPLTIQRGIGSVYSIVQREQFIQPFS